MPSNRLAPLLCLALAACGGAQGVAPPVRSIGTVAPTVTVRQPVRRPLRGLPPAGARPAPLPGTESVIGLTVPDLVRRFGTARLDVWEGDARKLQFVGPACVLDVFLYPAAPGRDPQSTYLDARRASDGKDVDRAACVTALSAARAKP